MKMCSETTFFVVSALILPSALPLLPSMFSPSFTQVIKSCWLSVFWLQVLGQCQKLLKYEGKRELNQLLSSIKFPKSSISQA